MGTLAESAGTLALLDHAGWRARLRPQTGLAHVLGAGAGFFAVAATEELVSEIRSDNPTVPGIALNVLLVLVAVAVALAPVGPARGAAVVALVFATPLIWLYAFYGHNQPGIGWLRAILLLSAAMYVGFYVLLWTRGRAIFLALTLLFVASYIEFEVHRQFEASTSATTIVPLPGQALNPFNLRLNAGISPRSIAGRTGDDQAIAALLLGVGFLSAGCILTRKRYLGTAVPFLVIGAIEGFAAAAVLGPNEGSVVLGGLLAAAVGAILALAGVGEGRRGSVWIGVLAIVVSLVIVISDATHDHFGRAGYAALIAVGLLAIAWMLMRPLGEAPDSGEPSL